MRDLRTGFGGTALALALLGCSGDSSQQQVTSSAGGSSGSGQQGSTASGNGAAGGGTGASSATGHGGTSSGGGGASTDGGGGFECDPPDPPDPNRTSYWTSIAPSPVPHGASASAVLLADGRVLLLGGQLTDSEAHQYALPNADIYDPILDTWAAASDMPSAQAVNTLLLPDGRLLASQKSFQGFNCPSSVWLYDPSLDTWTISAPGPLAIGNTLNALDSWRALLIAPDCTDSTIISQIYDASGDVWTPAAGIPEGAPHSPEASSTLTSGKVIIVGGSLGLEANEGKGADEYDPVTDSWAILAPMHYVRSSCAIGALTDGRLLVVGGGPLTEVFDPVGGEWKLAGSYTSCGDSYPTFAALPDGAGVAIGGYLAQGASALFQPSVSRWQAIDPVPDGERFAHTSVRLSDGSVLVLAGYVGFDDGECFGCPIAASTNWRLHLQ